MDGEHPIADSHRLSSLAEKFHDKQYRDSYVASHTRRVLAEQMRNFRGHLSQADYSVKLDKQKTVVGRLENPAYGGWSLRTMLEVARKENVAVIIRFVDFPTFLGFTDDFSDEALRPGSYDAIQTDEFAEFAARADESISYFNAGYQLGNAAIAPGIGMTTTGAPSLYTQGYGVSTQVSTALTFTQAAFGVNASPFFLPVESNSGMRDLVRRKNKEIFDLKNELAALRAELSDIRVNPPQRQEADLSFRLLMRPQSQGDIALPRAA